MIPETRQSCGEMFFTDASLQLFFAGGVLLLYFQLYNTLKVFYWIQVRGHTCSGHSCHFVLLQNCFLGLMQCGINPPLRSFFSSLHNLHSCSSVSTVPPTCFTVSAVQSLWSGPYQTCWTTSDLFILVSSDKNELPSGLFSCSLAKFNLLF